MSRRLLRLQFFIRSISRHLHHNGRAGYPNAIRGGIIGSGLGAVVLLLWISGLLQIFEEVTLDARYYIRYRLSPEEEEAAPVTVVAVDDRAIDAFGTWPWPRVVQAEAIRAVLEQEPSVVGITMLYSSASEDFRGDQRLAQSLKSDIPVVLASLTDGTRERTPLLNFLAPNVYTGHTNLRADWDGIVRRVSLDADSSLGPLRALSWEIAYRLGRNNPPGDGLKDSMRINFRPSRCAHLTPGCVISPTVSIVDVIEGRAEDAIRNRPVILGVVSDERKLTSLRSLGPIPEAHIHAAALSMILRDDYLEEQSFWYVILTLIGGGIIFGAALFTLRPWPSTIVYSGALLTFSLFVVWRFISYNEAIASVPVVTLLTGTYVAALWHAHSVSERTAKEVRETFSRYVAPEVVNAILSKPGVAEMEGGRRSVTVLFADLRGFTAFAEAHPPEEVVRVLNRYLEIMSESVLLYNGMLDKFVGDGLMALFGAPLPMENHAESAMGAGLHMLRTIERWHRSKDGVPLSVGIGIDSGEAIVGSVGSSARLEYTAIGDVVNVAARLQELARPGTIIVSNSTYDLLPEGVQAAANRLDLTRVRGRMEPVIAYELDPRSLKVKGDRMALDGRGTK